MNPLVSIVIPSFNSGHHISDCIDSIKKQSFKDWELLVVDGGSTDHTINLVNIYIDSDPRIKLIINDNDCGPAHARANGIRSALGEYIAFIDADDLWLPEKLELQVSLMEKYNYLFTYTLYRQISVDGLSLSPVLTARKSYAYPEYLGCRGIGNLTVLAKRNLFTRDILDTFKYRAEDTLWWLLIMKTGVTAYLVPQVLAYYRITPGSLSSQRLKNQSAVWNAYRHVIGLGVLVCSFYYASYIVDVLLRKLSLTLSSFFSIKSNR